jgi:glycosyltransferase involved in cell wall biosynthesis
VKVAIIHDWLVTYGGAERVLEQLLSLFPDADLFSTIEFVPEQQRDFLSGRNVRTSFIQGLPYASRHYRSYLPLMPLAVEQFDLSEYELILSSSYAVAKGVITGPDQLHICYIHSPMRYAWDLQHQYLRDSGIERGLKSALARAILHYLRIWDVRTANGVDHFVANSRFIARRVRKAYGRKAIVVHPPVDVNSFLLRSEKEDFYLTASRLVPYKRIDLIIQAFSYLPHRRLVVIGDGPERYKLERMAPPNVQILGYVPVEMLNRHMQHARAFVFASEEDFGIVPIEAQACGTPVIAYGKGGSLETVRGLSEVESEPTGVFFWRQTTDSLVSAINEFESAQQRFKAEQVRSHALGFGTERFRLEFSNIVSEYWEAFVRQR